MPEFHYYHDIEVRYGDLDPQGHVNNAKYLTYIEQARVSYIINLGLWDAKSFEEVGIILADAQLSFLAPIQFRQPVRVGVRVSRLGGKSLEMDYLIEDSRTHKALARGKTVIVAYDYRGRQSIPIPEVWRHAIATFENIPAQSQGSG